MDLLGNTFYRVEYAKANGDDAFKDFPTEDLAQRFCDRLEHRMINDRCDGYNVLKCEVIKDRWI